MPRKNARIDAFVLDALRFNPDESFDDFALENPFESATHPLEATRILNWPKFLARWEKLEKAAKKLGVDVGYEEVGEDFEPVDPRRPLGARRKVRLVQVWGDAPQINGWEFLARIDNLDQTHATASFAPGKETLVDPALWQAGTDCDHCRLKRYRTRRYALRCIDPESPDYGRIMIVGATCLKDFLGHASPESVALIASYLEDLSSLDFDPEGGSGDSTTYYYGVAETMPIVASLTMKLGFVSSKMEMPGKPSTATTLLYFLTPPRSEQARKEWVEFRKETAPSPDDQKLAADTIEWARNLEGASGYEMNIRAIASAENIGYRQMGMLASMVFAYMRAHDEAMRKKREREGRGESAHVGVVGEKITLDLTLRKTIELEGDYGTSYLYLFVTPEGYDVAWKASKRASYKKTMPYFTSVEDFFEYIKADERSPWLFYYYVIADDDKKLYPDWKALRKDWDDVSEDDVAVIYERWGVPPRFDEPSLVPQQYDSADERQMEKLLFDVNESTRLEIEEKRQKFDEIPIREGHTYRVQAKVKEHGDYKGRPQTKIERAKILAQL